MTWLIDANMVLKTARITAPKLPLSGYREQGAFKLFALDVGLLGALAKLDPRIFVSGHRLFTEFHGAFVENFVAQELVQTLDDRELHYWASEGTAEVDFVIQLGNQVLPLEAKAGENTRSRSLGVYSKKYKPQVALKLSLQNFKIQEDLWNIPLYAMEWVISWLKEGDPL